MAGLAAAYWCARQDPEGSVTVLEKAAKPMSWADRKGLTRILLGRAGPEGSGERAFERGWPEVGGLLEKWSSPSTLGWLETLGVAIETDPEGRFSTLDPAGFRDSLKREVEALGVEIRTGYSVESVSLQPGGGFRVWSREGDPLACGQVLLSSGGERNHGMKLASELGAEIREVLPAYLRLRLASPKLGDRLGPLERPMRLTCSRSGLSATGRATLSARGLEGEALSQLSCRLFEDWKQRGYRIPLEVDFLPEERPASVRAELVSRTESGRRKPLGEEPLFGLEDRQWLGFLERARIDPETPWARLKMKRLQTLVQRIKGQSILFEGMGLPMGERAWAGGAAAESLDWNRMELRNQRGLFLAGEILDILGTPGGAHANAIFASAHVAGSAMALAGAA